MGSSISVPRAYADSQPSPPPSDDPVPASDTKPVPTPPPTPTSTTSTSSSATATATASKSQTASKPQSWWGWLTGPASPDVPNPGTYDEISQEATVILRPNLIDGLSFTFNGPLSDAFLLGTAVEMGSKNAPPSFAFNANYYTNRLVMISRTSPDTGRVSARAFINHTPALTTKLVADVGPQPNSSRITCDFDYRATTSSSQLKLASGRIVALSHLHSLSPRFIVGAEALLQAQNGFGAVTLATKYHDASRAMSMSLASFGPVIVSYVRKVNPKVSFASELFMDARTRESHLTLGYRFDLSSAVVIGHVDSTGRVAATLEERINPALSLTLSGELDHAKENHSFGFGVNIGGG